VLRLASDDEYLMMGVAPDVLAASSPAGRGILDGNEVQVAVLGGTSNVALQARELKRLSDAMQRQGLGAASPIGKLADSIDLTSLPVGEAGQPIIGVDDEQLAPLSIQARGTFMIAGPPGSGRTTALVTVAQAVARSNPKTRLIHFSDRPSGISRLTGWTESASTPEKVSEFALKLVTQLEKGNTAPGSIALFVEGITDFTGTEAEGSLDRLVRLLVREQQFVVAEAETSTWSQAWTLAQPIKAGRRGLLLVPGDVDGDSLLGINLGRIRRADFPAGRGYVVVQGRARKLQVALGEPQW
jgi:S-DNA-T family DNA segregation ATPase FtsK/SpoIIIE